MSPTYLNGSWACTSIGLGSPPGPPRVSALINLLNNALCLILATYQIKEEHIKAICRSGQFLVTKCSRHGDTSSAQYLKSTGLSLRQRTAVFISSLTSGLSMSLSLLHSAWTHLDWETHHKLSNLGRTKDATILKKFYVSSNAAQIKYIPDP